MRFYEWNSVYYKELFYEPDKGILWIIRCDGNTAPECISFSNIGSMTEIGIPDEYISEPPKTRWQIEKRDERLSIISSLTENPVYITDNAARIREIRHLAVNHGLSTRTIKRWFYVWLAKGDNGLSPSDRTPDSSTVKSENDENFAWAIRTFYYSQRKMTLRETYESMLLYRYTDSHGVLLQYYPTLSQFLYYYNKYRANPNIGDMIRLHGQSDYARNHRPLYGKATDKVKGIGTYEMDATIADIYLVSSMDRTLCVGSPLIYLAVDVATQLIAGIYVGFEQGESAVIECIRNEEYDDWYDDDEPYIVSATAT